MEFAGDFELTDVAIEEVWLALSDPAIIADAAPGCQFIESVEGRDVDFDELREQIQSEGQYLSGDPVVIRSRAFTAGETYAALVELSIGPVNATFETVGEITEREEYYMEAAGEGRSSDSSFEVAGNITLSDTDDGVTVHWETEAEVFGQIATMGQRMINPVVNRLMKRFVSSLQTRLSELQIETPNGSRDET